MALYWTTHCALVCYQCNGSFSKRLATRAASTIGHDWKQISGLGGDWRSGGGESGTWQKQRYTFLSTFPHLSLWWNDRYKDHRDGQLTSPSSNQISGQGLWLAALNFLKTFFPFRLWLFVGEGSESYKTGLTTLPSFADPSIRKRRSSALQLFSFWDFFKNFCEIFILCKILTIYDDRVMSVQNISRITNAVQVTIWLIIATPQCHDSSFAICQ